MYVVECCVLFVHDALVVKWCVAHTCYRYLQERKSLALVRGAFDAPSSCGEHLARHIHLPKTLDRLCTSKVSVEREEAGVRECGWMDGWVCGGGWLGGACGFLCACECVCVCVVLTQHFHPSVQSAPPSFLPSRCL